MSRKETNMSSLLQIIRSEISKRLPKQVDKRFIGTVVSSNKDGTATIHLANDEIGNNIVCQNSRELPLEIGDNVYVSAVEGKLSSAFVDVRKIKTGNTIYQDFYSGDDITGNGTSSKPYKTPQKCIQVLPKNLNGRYVSINLGTQDPSSTSNLIIDGFNNGGRLEVKTTSGSPVNLNAGQIKISNCMGTVIVLNGFASNEVTKTAIYIDTSDYVEIDNIVMTSTSSYSGILFSGGSKGRIYNSTISNHHYAIECSYISDVFSDTNSGSGNYRGLAVFMASKIGIYGTQPIGTSSDYSDSSSFIVGNGKSIITSIEDNTPTSLNGVLKGNGIDIDVAISGTDYLAPNAPITGATKTKITYDTHGLVTSGSNATTADIADGTDKRYVTDSGLALLNSYTYNTYSPVVTGSSTDGSFTYTVQNGYYIKIGSLVHVSGYVSANAVTTAPTGVLKISLPFTIITATNYRSVGAARTSGINLGTSATQACVIASSGLNYLTVSGVLNNAASTNSDASSWGASDYVQFEITYISA